MRDLTSRLRAIVRTPLPDRPRADTPRELTYVPDVGYDTSDPDAAAEVLGGEVVGEAGGRYVTVERFWDGGAWHGRQRVESFVLREDAPVGLYDPRLKGVSGDTPLMSRPVFFDIETTGLAGGAGTLAFLVGCGWFEDGGFRVRQFFLAGPAGERAMLDALARIFRDASLLVTYNGRTFDVPTMDVRWAFHRLTSPADAVPHFDMLPPARRLWGRTSGRGGRTSVRPRGGTTPSFGGTTSCTLTALERSQLGFHRVGDVPGFEIPTRYFQYLRTGDALAIEDVLEHNRLDLISLAAVTARALELAADGPDACREPTEQLALGRLYERAGQRDRALAAYERAASGIDEDVRAHALVRTAVLLRRQGRHGEAARAWSGVIEGADERGGLSSLEQQAIEALAIHHEHRVRDLERARRYAERLLAAGIAGVGHRLDRLDRKLGRGLDTSEDTTGGREAARLFDRDREKT